MGILLGATQVASAQQGIAQAVLERPVTLQVDGVRLAEALLLLRHTQGVALAFSGDRLPSRRRVTLDVQDQPLGETLHQLLQGTNLQFVVTSGGTVVIVENEEPTETRSDTTDGMVDPDRLRSTIAATGIAELDDIVTMGSAVGAGPQREQPTGVQVVDRNGIREVGEQRMGDLIRQALPGVVLWDRGPIGPPPAVASVRGQSSFGIRAPKTYVDGVELAEPELFTLIDGWSVDRLEFIGGPQGAALYGPDAVGGILQISTRTGEPGARRMRARGVSSFATHDRSDLNGTALLQEHSVGVTGGSASTGIDLGVSFSQLSGAGLAPWTRSWHVHGGSQTIAGPVTIQVTSRATRYDYRAERTLLNAEAVISAPRRVEEWGTGINLVHQLTSRWSQTLVFGHSWAGGTRQGLQSPLLPPIRQLAATDERASRTSLRYATTLDLGQRRAVATVSLGGELSRRRVERSVRDAVSTGNLSALSDDTQRSGGGFVQVRLRPHPGLVLSGGVRGERLSSVGPAIGTVWASTAGVSWSRDLGPVALRLRGAWGRGIRPPEVGTSDAAETPTVRQLANHSLEPERQRGLEAGVELYFPSGAWITATGFSQRATDLIESVDRRRPEDQIRIYQFQNIGAITNRGAELSAGVASRAIVAQANVHLVSSRVAALSPSYTGELRVGDRLIDVPEVSAAASLQYYVGRFRFTVGATALGPWTGYDWFAIARATRGDEPVRQRGRDYWFRYPFLVRPSIGGTVDLGNGLSAHLQFDNPGNSSPVVRDNLSPPLGSTLHLGLHLEP